ncbi:inositol 2-dehydrogenase [Vagococcus fluvialis]|uniref:inositol 2-dehydrogenase n=1 Tax=Vagococcus fluvialis TaxID=2738 RepID=UPI0037D18333
MKTIKVGLVGLGRLGFSHAKNIVQKVPQMELAAVCSVVPEELERAKSAFNTPNLYSDYNEMLANKDLDAIMIASPSGFHCQQIQEAIIAGFHVFCEKPIGLTKDEINKTIEVIKQHPNQKFMLGFMRRFDDSYRYAKELINQGEIGEITVIRCYGIDPSSGLESFVNFSKNNNSGGIFADMAIHDIDLIRWFTSQEVTQVWALGKNAAYPELDEVGEIETGSAMMELKNGTMALLVTGRNAAHGYHVETEIIGTKGMLRVGESPDKNLVTIYNEQGKIRPCSQNFPERFGPAFVNEMIAFSDCIINDTPSPITEIDGLKATKIANACQESFNTKKLTSVN